MINYEKILNDDGVHEISGKLCEYDTWIVGGCLRDTIWNYVHPDMMREINDIDMVTNADVETVKELFPTSTISGTCHEIFNIKCENGITYELSLLGSQSIEDNLSERDFMVNSVGLHVNTGKIYNEWLSVYFTEELGLSTIETKDTDMYCKLKKDPLRLYRIARMVAMGYFDVSFILDAHVRHFLEHNDPIIPVERIRDEIMKSMLVSTNYKFFDTLVKYDIINKHLKPMSDMIDVDGGDYHNESVWDHCMNAGFIASGLTDNPLLVFAAFIHDIGKPVAWNGKNFISHNVIGADIVESLITELKFSTKDILYVKTLVSCHMDMVFDVKDSTLRKHLKRLDAGGVDPYDFIILRKADFESNKKHDDKYPEEHIAKYIEAVKRVREPFDEGFTIKSLKINGNDVMNILNLNQGKEVGDVLREIFECVMENPEMNERETLLKHIGVNYGQ